MKYYGYTIEYINKNNNLKYVRFDAKDNEKEISLFCCDDASGSKDIQINIEELKNNFIEIDKYIEEQ